MSSKIFRRLIIFLLVAGTIVMMTGCNKIMESWAYDYEPTVESLRLYQNGTAVFKGEKYKYTKDENYINLSNKKEDLKLRYIIENGGMSLYSSSTYYAASDVTDGSIVGTWLQDNGWSFIFSETGEFSEEGIFFGHYSLDEDNRCIKLMYEDPVPDIYLYYTLDGKNLTIEYPWQMVPTESK